jgi:hypothetical protein
VQAFGTWQGNQPLPIGGSWGATLTGLLGAIISSIFFCLLNPDLRDPGGKAHLFSIFMYKIF